MSPVAGQRLGPYEIVAPIGAGGMGEVWKARDTRLDRSVAIKMLPEELAANAQLRLRFEREAKAIAQLAHPNICPLYDVGDDYLVMELLDGESLADRLTRGPLSPDQVLRFGIEIASALHCAHRGGIVHRDLKPGNVMLTRSGAKLLDFGLAKSFVSGIHAGDATTAMATQARPLTEEGMIVGTYYYMSPEQLTGGVVDHRSDIFAFGAVLYEMVTGRRAFEGKTRTSVVASILGRDPEPLTAVNADAPPPLERIVAACMARDPDDRWQSAHDVGLELKAVRDAVPARPETAQRSAFRWLTVAAIAVVAAAIGFAAARRIAPKSASAHLNIAAPPGMKIRDFVLSPRGNAAAMITEEKHSLWLRDLGAATAREVEHSDGAYLPFWSPDGRWVAFFTDNALYKVPAAGGSPVLIHDGLGFVDGGSWGADDAIIFADDVTGNILRVSASGGALTIICPPDRKQHSIGNIWPSFLPDGRHFLYLNDAVDPKEHWIRIGSLDPKEKSTPLVQAESNAVYAGGYLLFVKSRTLMAQPFDPDRRAVEGEAQAVADNIADTDFHHYVFSATDRIVSFSTFDPRSRLHLFDRGGRETAVFGTPADWTYVAWSPDGRHVAMNRVDADRRNDQIWIADLVRGTFDHLETQQSRVYSGVWSGDGSELLYSTDSGFFRKRIDGSGERRIETVAGRSYASSWRDDWLAVEVTAKTNPADVEVVSITTGQRIPIATTPAWENDGALSPDRRWIAYQADGRVVVKPLPPTGAQFTIVSSRAEHPRWRGDARELYYLSDKGIFAVPIEEKGNAIEAGAPQLLVNVAVKEYKNRPNYDVSPDGQRFLVNVQDSYEQPVHVILDWTSTLHQ
ncbi:MAG: protein kinase [Thermoanaerobaculia bacterium]